MYYFKLTCIHAALSKFPFTGVKRHIREEGKLRVTFVYEVPEWNAACLIYFMNRTTIRALLVCNSSEI